MLGLDTVNINIIIVVVAVFRSMLLLTGSLKAHQGTGKAGQTATRAIKTKVRKSRENLSVRCIIIAFPQIVMVTESVGGSANQPS